MPTVAGGFGLVGRCIGLGAVALTVVVSPRGAQAQNRGACDLSFAILAQRAAEAPRRENLAGGYRILPGGAVARVTLGRITPDGAYWCARLGRKDRAVRVLAVTNSGTADSGSTELRLAIPDYGVGWLRSSELVLVAFAGDSAARPLESVTTRMTISNRWIAWAAGLLVVGVGYLLATLTLGGPGKLAAWHPVRLTAGASGGASLSQFQIFGFTLVVVFLLTTGLVRTGLLSDISSDLLLLLGISAGGAAGSKVAGVLKRRLSLESWAWLRNHKWLEDYEPADRSRSGPDQSGDGLRWSDLLKTENQFDVYSFQLATVSLLVAMGLLTTEFTELASFSLPQNILALLGLSNVVYIGGKAVAPNAVMELDKKVEELRPLETALKSAAAGGDAAATAAARSAYLAAAMVAARMVFSLYGTSRTKFKAGPIKESDVLPEGL